LRDFISSYSGSNQEHISEHKLFKEFDIAEKKFKEQKQQYESLKVKIESIQRKKELEELKKMKKEEELRKRYSKAEYNTARANLWKEHDRQITTHEWEKRQKEKKRKEEEENQKKGGGKKDEK
jgi:hypothetical protein